MNSSAGFCYYHWVSLAFVAFLLFSQVWDSGWCNDESAHIPAGLYHLTTGRMDSYEVNPPLPRLIGALPLLNDAPTIEWSSNSPQRGRSEYRYADSWIGKNKPMDVRRQLRLARFATAFFFFVGAWAVHKWALALNGVRAARLATALWCFSPDVISHSAVVASDAPAAATGVLVGFLYWKWLASTDCRIPWNVGLAVGLAICCKFSWLLLLPLLPCTVLAYELLRPSGEQYASSNALRMRFSVRRTSRLAMALLLSVFMVNLCYGFDGTGKRLDEFDFISALLTEKQDFSSASRNRFVDTWLGAIPVPLPQEMVRGIDYLQWEFDLGKASYLRGVWQHGGWWYFHVYALAVKMPLGFLLLMSIGTVSTLSLVVRGEGWYRCEWFPLFVAIVFIVVISSKTGFTHHVRYVLPAYGFLFVVASRAMVALPRQLATVVAVLSMAGTLAFHLLNPGVSHTFFNLAAGGPNNGFRHLSYSNCDWGQSTYRMAEWAAENPEKRPLIILFRSKLGRPERLVETLEGVTTSTAWGVDNQHRSSDAPGGLRWCLVSSHQLTLQKNESFRAAVPVSRPWPDVFLFKMNGSSPITE